jgi:hypothetical protein
MIKQKYKPTEETKRKLSRAWSYEKHFTPETKRKISESLKGKKHSEETKKKISEIKKRMFLEGTLKIPNNFGRHLSKETKEKLRKINLGKKLSEEHRKKMSESRKGRIVSQETRRKISQSQIGEKSWSWKGGTSFEPYPQEFNNRFKLAIKQRDGFLCLKCGMREEDSLVLFKQKLHVHHIDYNKRLTILENCCALCLRCNMEVNSNRNSWKKFFQSMLSEKYGYQYSENGEVILNLGEDY